MRLHIVSIVVLMLSCVLGLFENVAISAATPEALPAGAARSSKQLAHEAAESMRAGDANRAIEIYEELRRGDGIENGEILYNLGNAYYRTGKFAQAIAAYKGALKFLPRDGDLAANLEYARKHKVDTVEERPDYSKMIFFWLEFASLGELLAVAAISLSLFLVFLVFCRLFFGNMPLWPRLVLGLLSAFFCFSFVGKWAVLANTAEAVVGVREIEVKSGDADENITLFSLHEGTEVALGQRRGGWAQVFLPDGKKGWVKGESLIPVASEVRHP